MKRWLVVGLGNPGQQYLLTRHNIGFFVVDQLVKCLDARHAGAYSTFELWASLRPGREVYLMKPTTFMNLSGDALADFLNLRSVPLTHLMVIFDDVALPLGTLRIRPSGSAGGHRGMDHIIDVLSSNNVPRMRLGIDGSGRQGRELRAYVLEAFLENETPLVDRMVHRAAEAVAFWFDEDLSRVMGKFNGKVRNDEDAPTPGGQKSDGFGPKSPKKNGD